MKKTYAILFALLMMTVSLAGCLESNDEIAEDQFEVIFNSNDHQNILGAQFFELNGITYFAISSSLNLENLGIYQTDGTEDGTELIWEPSGASMGDVFVLQSSLVFQVGMELWASDGTSLGTEMIADFSASAELLRIVSWDANNVGVFVTHEHSSQTQLGSASLWISDSTTAGTIEVFQYQEIDYQWYADSANSILYFVANDSQSGNELWMSDGTTQGTSIYNEMVSGSDGAIFQFVYATNHNVFWSTLSASGSSWEYRASNIMTGTTELIYSNPNITTIDLHFVIGDNLYFGDLNQNDETQLYISDGTVAGTAMIHQFSSLHVRIHHAWTIGLEVYLSVYEQGSLGSIWLVDSSNQLSLFGTYHGAGSTTTEIPLIYFTSSDDGIAGCSIGTNGGATGCGSNIFTTNGTLSGTNILLEINGDIGYLTVHSGILYFTQDHTINAIVLY